MLPKSTIFALALLAPVIAFAGDSYVPKFAKLGAGTAAASPTAATTVIPDTAAEILDFITCPKPPYPMASIRNEETGKTTMRFAIAPTGEVMDAVIASSSGFRDLDQAALGAMRACLFRPASKNGVPVDATVTMQYVWSMK